MVVEGLDVVVVLVAGVEVAEELDVFAGVEVGGSLDVVLIDGVEAFTSGGIVDPPILGRAVVDVVVVLINIGLTVVIFGTLYDEVHN